jgi:hypothetical protein
MSSRNSFAALLAATLLAGCGQPPSPEEQAAYADVRQRFNYSEDIRARPPRVEDRGDRWRIYFPSPPMMVGGDAVVDVRKSDHAILLSVAGQ